jgi:uncharacterized protein YbbC (DUF1343 family)
LTRRQFTGLSILSGLTALTAQGCSHREATASLRAALREAVTSTGQPGAVAYVGGLNRTYVHKGYGYRQLKPENRPANRRTIYDLASVTKVLATTTALLILRDQGELELDQPAGDYVPLPGLERFTLRNLLTHTSGLPWGDAMYREVCEKDELLQHYSELALISKPGSRWIYSDAGFVILGAVVERVAGTSLDKFCAEHIFDPLGMQSTVFNPPDAWKSRCAATEKCAWRKRVMLGEVHDENAWAIGGVAGNAGLFSTASDMALFCRALLSGKVLAPSTLSEMTRIGQVPSYPWQGLGWQIDPWPSGGGGYLPSRGAFGHTGWTGTSVWMDPASGLFAILLANTCHPSRTDRKNTPFRQKFHSCVSDAFYTSTSNVHTGLDRVMREDFRPLRGKTVGILTNQAAVDQLGRPLSNVFDLASDVELKFFCSPEHGFSGQAEAGQKVSDKTARIPVFSLYGERQAPPPDQLREIDYFVVDLQDVGARYYTYMATMLDCMRACARVGTTVLVLDRPNPLGGDVLEGPIAENTSSLVCCAPIPVRHGMTMGELALFFRDKIIGTRDAKVLVHRVDSWSRDQLFRACSLPWIAPSPNIPTPETALLYIGLCLLEGTNLNEGRGTNMPFFLMGAPWLDAKLIIAEIAPEEKVGCALHVTQYTPRSIPGKASNPIYQDAVCNGVRVEIVDAHQVRAFTLGLALIAAARRVHSREFEFNAMFDILAGSARLREDMERGRSAAAIVHDFAAPLRAFDEERPKLYQKNIAPDLLL